MLLCLVAAKENMVFHVDLILGSCSVRFNNVSMTERDERVFVHFSTSTPLWVAAFYSLMRKTLP